MGSTKLLWNCGWRTVLWGLGLGVGLGAAYGGLALPLGILVTTVLYARMDAITNLAGLPAAMLFGVPLGIIAGVILGTVAGTLLGVLNGLLLCALTYLYFLKTGNAVAYRRFARTVGAIVTISVLVAAWVMLGSKPDSFAGGGPVGTIDGGVADIVFWEIGPVFVAAWAAQFANKKAADYCISNESRVEAQFADPSTNS